MDDVVHGHALVQAQAALVEAVVRDREEEPERGAPEEEVLHLEPAERVS